jgi:hypothetical protein
MFPFDSDSLLQRMEAVELEEFAFESGSHLRVIDESCFQLCSWTLISISRWVETLDNWGSLHLKANHAYAGGDLRKRITTEAN